ncbi:MAG: SDR family oxidoreductase [Omnitrophica bacterium]|nr:SDR family oxidoreductase [Candidatus Omnitrophota bacterium]
MRILVAGGGGYLGSALVPALLDRGYKVKVADLFWFGNYLPKKADILKRNVFDMTKHDLKGCDQVIFLAGVSNDPMAEFSPSKNFIFNTAAPTYLAYVSKKIGIRRFIYASTCSIYGYGFEGLCDENYPISCSYPYGISKFQGEQGVIQMTAENFSVICLRMGTISGYSPRMRLDLAVNAMFRSAMVEGKITIKNASLWRPILGMHDAINIYLRTVEVNEKISGVFNVASGNYMLGELGDLVREGIEKRLNKKIGIKILDKKDYRSYKVNINKAKEVLSFKPTYDVDCIVKDLVDNMNKFKDYDNPRYYNIKIFTSLLEKRSNNTQKSRNRKR